MRVSEATEVRTETQRAMRWLALALACCAAVSIAVIAWWPPDGWAVLSVIVVAVSAGGHAVVAWRRQARSVTIPNASRAAFAVFGALAALGVLAMPAVAFLAPTAAQWSALIPLGSGIAALLVAYLGARIFVSLTDGD